MSEEDVAAEAGGLDPEEARFRAIFRAAHSAHAACADDEWLHQPCMATAARPAARPLVWSRRNGAWRRVEVLWVGAAPGNAGGLGSGALGAHATRIPFGGDIAGGNLDVMLSAMGITRNDTFLIAALNQLPERGGGEPAAREIAAPVGDYSDSVALLRDTILAAGPRLIIALGNVALRVTAAALTRRSAARADAAARHPAPLRLPGAARLAAAGVVRGRVAPWPDDVLPIDPAFRDLWRDAWQERPAFDVLQVLHPSAQNMSPFAGTTTVFHERMLITLDALRAAVRASLGREPPASRQPPPTGGIYSLPEWIDPVGPVHRRYDELWRARGV